MHLRRFDEEDRGADNLAGRDADETSERNSGNGVSQGTNDEGATPSVSPEAEVDPSPSTHDRGESTTRTTISSDDPKTLIEALDGYGIRMALSAMTGAKVYRPFGQVSYDADDSRIPFEAQCPLGKPPHEHMAWFNDDEQSVHCWACRQKPSYAEVAATLLNCTEKEAAEKLREMMPNAADSTFKGCRLQGWFVGRAREALPRGPVEVVGLPYVSKGAKHDLPKADGISEYFRACRNMNREQKRIRAAHAWHIGHLLEEGEEEEGEVFKPRMQQIYRQIFNGVEAPWLIDGKSINKVLREIRRHRMQRIPLARSRDGNGVDVNYFHGKIGHRFAGKLEITFHDRPTAQILTTIHRRSKEELEAYAAKMGGAVADLLETAYTHSQIADLCETLLQNVHNLAIYPEGAEAARANALKCLEEIASAGGYIDVSEESEFVLNEDPRSMRKAEVKECFAELWWPKSIRDRYRIITGDHAPTGDKFVMIPISSNGRAQYVGFLPDELGAPLLPSSSGQQHTLFGLKEAVRGRNRSAPADSAGHICIFADPRDVVSAAAVGCKGVASSHEPNVWLDEWSRELAEKGYTAATILFPKREIGPRQVMRVATSLDEAGVVPSIVHWPEDVPNGTNVALYVADPENHDARRWRELESIRSSVTKAHHARLKAASGRITEIVEALKPAMAGDSALSSLLSGLQEDARRNSTEGLAQAIDKLSGAGHTDHADRLQEAVATLREADAIRRDTLWKLKDAIERRDSSRLSDIAKELTIADLPEEADGVTDIARRATDGLHSLIESAERVTY